MARYKLVLVLVAVYVAGGVAARRGRGISGGVAAGRSSRFGNNSPSNSITCGCQCSPLTLRDKYGRTSGNCLSSWLGSKWCYVDSWNSPCADLRKSSKTRNPWSYEACNAPVPNPCKQISDGDEEIPFPAVECRPGEENLPDDPYCCRRINDPGFIYCI